MEKWRRSIAENPNIRAVMRPEAGVASDAPINTEDSHMAISGQGPPCTECARLGHSNSILALGSEHFPNGKSIRGLRSKNPDARGVPYCCARDGHTPVALRIRLF